MKKSVLFVLFASVVANLAFAQTYVQPHVRKDGTYVEGHYRSSPNSTKIDNYGSQGNVNPYTGKEGTQDPFAVKNTQPVCFVNSSGQYVCK